MGYVGRLEEQFRRSMMYTTCKTSPCAFGCTGIRCKQVANKTKYILGSGDCHGSSSPQCCVNAKRNTANDPSI